MTESQTRQADQAMTARNNIEALRARIVQRYESLSPRLKQVAAYALEHPNDLGLETLAVIARRCKVQPSTIVRFAKTFGYDGAQRHAEVVPRRSCFRSRRARAMPTASASSMSAPVTWPRIPPPT